MRATSASISSGESRRSVPGDRTSSSFGAFLALLGPGGPVSAREIGHRPVADPGHLLATLQACYQAFAYAPVTEEAPDHVSVEVGFMAYLRLKQAFALAEPLSLGLEPWGDSYLGRAARALFRTIGPRRVEEAGWVPKGLDNWACEEGCSFGEPGSDFA